MEKVKGKMEGKIVEKGLVFSTWISHGERGLAWLLEGVKAYCIGNLEIPSWSQ